MSTNQADGASRAENRGEDVPYPILVLQVSLTALLLFMILGWGHLTLNAILDPDRVVTEFFWALPAPFGVAAALLFVTVLSR